MEWTCSALSTSTSTNDLCPLSIYSLIYLELRIPQVECVTPFSFVNLCIFVTLRQERRVPDHNQYWTSNVYLVIIWRAPLHRATGIYTRMQSSQMHIRLIGVQRYTQCNRQPHPHKNGRCIIHDRGPRLRRSEKPNDLAHMPRTSISYSLFVFLHLLH